MEAHLLIFCLISPRKVSRISRWNSANSVKANGVIRDLWEARLILSGLRNYVVTKHVTRLPIKLNSCSLTHLILAILSASLVRMLLMLQMAYLLWLEFSLTFTGRSQSQCKWGCNQKQAQKWGQYNLVAGVRWSQLGCQSLVFCLWWYRRGGFSK